MVRFDKTYKIDLNEEYPCPCGCKGSLKPIMLTEAFGCDRCQQIFVVLEDGQTLEQLASLNPQKKLWRWNGKKWVLIRPQYNKRYLLFGFLAILVMVIIILLSLILRSPSGIGMIPWGVVAFLLVVLFILIAWLVYRY
jgi:hypothetical protein